MDIFIILIPGTMNNWEFLTAKNRQSHIGIFYIIAVSSLGVIGILMAGWASNNKYSMIGAMRSGAQLISYELSAGLSLMTIVVLSGTMQLSDIVANQADTWYLFQGHIPAVIAFIIYLIATVDVN